MSDEKFPAGPKPTPERPLQGITILVVDDSHFASEAIRLMSRHSGARLRRAPSLATARRHLAVYRPTTLIADMGLPDGSGAELIAECAIALPHRPVLIGMSGDTGAEPVAMAAGADGFLAKPVESLALFQQTLLKHLGTNPAGSGPHALPMDRLMPDRLALADDLHHVAELVERQDRATLGYVAQFLGGVARSARDEPLEEAATRLARSQATGGESGVEIARVSGMLQERLAEIRVV